MRQLTNLILYSAARLMEALDTECPSNSHFCTLQMYLGVMEREFLDVESRGTKKNQAEEDRKDAASQGVDIASMGRLSSGAASHPILSRTSLKKT